VWSWETPQKLFQNDAGRRGVGIARATGQGLGGAVALVHLVHRQTEAPAQLARALRAAVFSWLAPSGW
jgi:galactokinase